MRCGFFSRCCRGADGEAEMLLAEAANQENAISITYGSARPTQLFHDSYSIQDQLGEPCISLLNENIRRETIFGWKLHVSVEQDVAIIRKVWTSIIIPILTKYNIGEFKVAKPEYLDRFEGRIFTIYLAYNPEFQKDSSDGDLPLSDVLTEIEKTLIGQGIRPGKKAAADRRIQGSRFISYRCELGQMIDEEDNLRALLTSDEAIEHAGRLGAEPFNPYNVDDSFDLANINLQPVRLSRRFLAISTV